MTVGICDDETEIIAAIRNIIEKNCEEFEENINVLEFSNGEKLCKDIRISSINVLFLDIEMPGMDGISVGEYVRNILLNDDMFIVFVTGKEGYERRLFEYHPLNFIQKPIEERKIVDCLRKANRMCKNNKRLFSYVSEYEKNVIEIGRIQYFQTSVKSVEMVTDAEERIHINMPVKKIMEWLEGDSFLKISQSVIVNVKYVKYFDSCDFHMSDGSIHKVSRDRLKEIRIKYSVIKSRMM